MFRTKSESNLIKVGILISYDASLALICLRQIYSESDKIVLALDKDRRTWNGDKYVLPELFFDQVIKLDVNCKIEVYEDDFYVPGLSPMGSETRARRLLADRLGVGGWHVQVDADEYYIDFPSFIAELRRIEGQFGEDAVEVRPQWVTMFKQDEAGYFLVHPLTESFAAATNRPDYMFGRNCSEHEHRMVGSTQLVLHQSWARSRDELEKKISNFSHCNDFDGESYLRFWDYVSPDTCRYIHNFHPIYDEVWNNLIYFSGTIEDLMQALASKGVLLSEEPVPVPHYGHVAAVSESSLANEKNNNSIRKRILRKVFRFFCR